MKKLLLLITILTLSITTYSQSFYRVIQNSKSEWNTSTEKWETVGTQQPQDLFIIVNNSDITIGEYKFKTYDQPVKTTYETHVCYTWKCINQNGVKCILLMKAFPNTTNILFSILYDTGIMYEYETLNQ